jgi:predicted GIY-YIG superfamily endonuclease
MQDEIVTEVRKIRREIESENKNDWVEIERSFKEMQKRHKTRLYKGTPKPLPARHVA